MPGLFLYSDIELFHRHKLLVNKAYYKSVFLIYIVHNNNQLYLYKVQQGFPVRLQLIRDLRTPLDIDSFSGNLEVDCTLHSTRVVEDLFTVDNILIAIVSTNINDRTFGLSFNNWA